MRFHLEIQRNRSKYGDSSFKTAVIAVEKLQQATRERGAALANSPDPDSAAGRSPRGHRPKAAPSRNLTDDLNLPLVRLKTKENRPKSTRKTMETLQFGPVLVGQEPYLGSDCEVRPISFISAMSRAKTCILSRLEAAR